MAGAALAAAAWPLAARAAELLPEASVHLKAARYAPVETDLHWTGWIGAGAGLLRAGGATAYFTADAETILGNTLRPFEATQANYHLEVGARRRFGAAEVALALHHVSRHAVDRPKVQAVDWNMLLLRLSRGFSLAGRPAQARASVGRTTQASLPGYEWELTARFEAELAGGEAARAYACLDARVVTIRDVTRPPATLPRGDFVDLGAEAGVRLRRGPRVLDLFAAFERRNDVFLEIPGRRDRALFGFRIALSGG